MKHFLLSALLVWGVVIPLSAAGRYEGSIRKTWDYPPGIKTLVIDAEQQDLVIKTGGPRITGRLVGDSGEEIRISRSGDTLTLTARGYHSFFSFRRQSARIEVSVPKGIELDLTTASGAILIQVPTEGLKARSASGDIEAPQGGTQADVDSTSGTVRLKAFGGPVKASSLSGDVILEDLGGEIQASTMSGNVVGHNLAPGDKSRFSSVSGDVYLRLVGGSDAFAVRMETVSGDLELGAKSGQDRLEGGSGPQLTAKSVSGDVRVR